ncbi:MAG: UDP-N-acetylglucosamine--N-acetylmuramyl-(pentapeptide) pyrophosphoryl-undecaprenol N-acetylglucosamine transferase [Elusimicrobiota bacterium]
MKRVLIAAGGTGGHFYPGLALAQAIKARGWQPLIAIKSEDPAKPRLEAADLAWVEIDLRGLPRGLSLETVVFAGKLLAAAAFTCRVVRDFKPDLVLGMGGYLTFPVALAAWRYNIPFALHESNSILGLANSAAVKLGGELFWGLPPKSGQGRVVGTPIRSIFFTRQEPAAARKKLGLDPARSTVLIFGGSQGAQTLNDLLPRQLKSSKSQILHLAGKGKVETAHEAYRREGIQATVLEYLDDMPAAYGAADLVICRAGASTLAELASQRKPAVLIPFPHAAANHQEANARVFERAGAAVCVCETEFGRRMGPILFDLLESPDAPSKRAAMASAYGSLGLPAPERTTEMLMDALQSLARP